jgi:hypothetical protein
MQVKKWIFRIIHLIMFMNFLKTNVLRNFHTIKIVIELNSENNCSLYMVTAVILNFISAISWREQILYYIKILIEDINNIFHRE